MKDAPTEYEVKFFPIDMEEMRAKLKECGATIKKKERLMRRCVFNHAKNPGMKCTYIRVRDEGDRITFSAKQHAADGKIGSQKEYETIVEGFETAREILLNAGLVQTGHQENKRETWETPDGTLVELETWPGLPNYLEIEGKNSEAVQQTAVVLGLEWDEHIIASTATLYTRHIKIDQQAALEKLSHLTFSGQ